MIGQNKKYFTKEDNMKRLLIVMLSLIIVGFFASTVIAADYPWNKLVFPSDNESIVSRMLLELQPDNTLTAYLLVRDVIWWNKEKNAWERQPLEKLAFTSYIQSPSGFFEDVIEGLYWASDQTGWGIEAPNWLWHDNTYKYAYYIGGETVSFGQETFWRRKAMFVIQGIPLPPPGTVFCAQFLLRYKNRDGSFDYVWLNPGYLASQDRQKYWVPDLFTPDGLVIRGKFINGRFVKVPKKAP